MRVFSTFLIIFFVLTGCRDKVICPAFQSTYILDDSVRLAYYSYLWKLSPEERLAFLAEQRAGGDTSVTASILPSNKTDYFGYVEKYVVPAREVNKSKFGIVKYEPYWLKNQRLKTAPMENILAPEKPSEDTTSYDVGEFVASDFGLTDSTELLDLDSSTVAIDSTALVTETEDTTGFVLPTLARAPPPPKKKETKYLYRYDPKDERLNIEQEYYNKYFGQLLIDNRPEPEPVPIDSAALVADQLVEDNDSTKLVERRGFGVRFNFGKGKKNKDALSEEEQIGEPDDLNEDSSEEGN